VQLSGPDFVKIAEAYDIPAMRVTSKLEVPAAIEKAMSYKGAFLIDFVVEPEENVFPIVPPGAALVEYLEMPKNQAVTPSTKPR
jgi:acetolactate synthase-1/2/3 large subunit